MYCTNLLHFQNVSCQLNESIASLSSLGSTRSLKEEEQEAKMKELEQELKVVTGDKVNLQSQLMVIKAKEGKFGGHPFNFL